MGIAIILDYQALSSSFKLCTDGLVVEYAIDFISKFVTTFVGNAEMKTLLPKHSKKVEASLDIFSVSLP